MEGIGTQQAGEQVGSLLNKMAARVRGESEAQNWHSGKLTGHSHYFLEVYYLAILDLSHPLNYQYLSLWHYRGLRTSCPYLMYMLSRLLYSHLDTKHKIFRNSTPSSKYLSAFSSFSGTWHLSNSVEEMSFPVTTQRCEMFTFLSSDSIQENYTLGIWAGGYRPLCLFGWACNLISPTPDPKLTSARAH